MPNCWAIAIGINQYQSLQPLLYAQWDAHAIQTVLTQDAHFPPSQCLLLTDTSPAINGHSTQPTREAIQQFVVQVCQQKVQPGDVFWFFFSGYAVQEAGRDYLLPSDGDPMHPIATGIPMSELMATLRTAPTENIVILLDLKRCGHAVSDGSALGEHSIALAHEHRLALFLASQPNQFSHETLALRQGLFTAALLEGLRSQGSVTLAHLAQYLGDRLPELSQQHWRPRQDPAIVIPADLRYQLMLPGKAFPGQEAPVSQPPEERLSSPGLQPPPQSDLDLEPPPPAGPVPTPPPHAQPVPAPEPPSAAPAPSPSEPGQLDDGAGEPDQFWRKVLQWGGLLLLLLLLGVLLRNWPALRGPQDSDSPNAGAAGAEASPPPQANASEAASNELPVANGGDPGTEGDEAVPLPDASPQSALESAEVAIAAGQPEEALRWLDLVPPNEQTDIYEQLKAEAEALNSQVGQTNRAILDEAIASMNRAREQTPVNQASDFHRAITQANRIQPGQPLYDTAQQHIQRWSRVILDLAQARAKTGNYADAIAAAQLVPPQTEWRAEAEQLIATWQDSASQRGNNQQVLEQAQSLIRPGEASSYNEAIAQLRSVQPDQPGYDEARAQIDRWGQDILQLAYGYADAGNLYDAVNAAALVPEDSSAYLEAREAIAGWRRQLRGS